MCSEAPLPLCSTAALPFIRLNVNSPLGWKRWRAAFTFELSGLSGHKTNETIEDGSRVTPHPLCHIIYLSSGCCLFLKELTQTIFKNESELFISFTHFSVVIRFGPFSRLVLLFFLCVHQLKWCAWIAVYCSFISFANSRSSEDTKQMMSSFMWVHITVNSYTDPSLTSCNLIATKTNPTNCLWSSCQDKSLLNILHYSETVRSYLCCRLMKVQPVLILNYSAWEC